MRVVFAVLIACCFGCGLNETVANLAVFSGGLPSGVVQARGKGNAVLQVGGAAHAGSRDEPVADPSKRGYGASVQSHGVGIASHDSIGVAARGRLEVGAFGDDYLFGDLAIEIGAGFLMNGRIGGGVTTGWNYGGYFASAHSLPARALVYVDTGAAIVHATAHRSWRHREWDAWGTELGIIVPGIPAGFGARFERQDGTSTFTVSAGWALHTLGARTKPPPLK